MPKTKTANLVLWGFHASHGNIPIKLCDYTAKAERQRQKDGWTCGVYQKGDEPVGLAIQAAVARAEAALRDAQTAKANGMAKDAYAMLERFIKDAKAKL